MVQKIKPSHPIMVTVDAVMGMHVYRANVLNFLQLYGYVVWLGIDFIAAYR